MKKSLLVFGLLFSSASFANDISFSSSIVDSSISLNNQPATVIYAVNSDTNYCTITVVNSLIKSGSVLHSEQRSNSSNYTINCDWNGKHFVESQKQKSSSSIAFKSDKRLIIDFNLVTSKGDDSLITKSSSLSIEK